MDLRMLIPGDPFTPSRIGRRIAKLAAFTAATACVAAAAMLATAQPSHPGSWVGPQVARAAAYGATLTADLACTAGPHECIPAAADHAGITVPGNGVQPTCPAADFGWTETATMHGPHGQAATFLVRCDRAGDSDPFGVWDALT